MSDRIDETAPGGRYMGEDGRLHDANGKPIEAEARSQEPEETLPATSVQESQPEQAPAAVPAETLGPKPIAFVEDPAKALPEIEPSPKPARKRKA
jgi:hypothetical protein